MHDDRALIEGRLSRALNERIQPAIYQTVREVDVSAWNVASQDEPVDPAFALQQSYQPFRVGDVWGPAWGTTWFRFAADVPPELRDHHLEVVIDLGWNRSAPGFQAEGLAYRADGSAVKGLHPQNHWLPVDGERFDVFVEAAANPVVFDVINGNPFRVTSLGEKTTAGDEPHYVLRRADLAIFDQTVWELVRDLEVLDGLMRELPVDQPRRWEILRAVDRALDELDMSDVSGTAGAARKALEPVSNAPAAASAHNVSAVGHAHIDTAWLWPVRETVRKVARTSSNVVALMDDHPEFTFAMSQAQQFAWLKEHRPQIYARVREKVAMGQFVPVGGMWVESDTNLPGGESLVRQFVYGKRFFLDEFGIETEEVWLPDSFGYSAAMPQLVALSGARWFLTQKISWSRTNKFPHHTFWWEGIDGTRVFTHFPPVDSYNAELTGGEMAHLVRNFRDKGDARRSLVPFGYGDGGGGPTREMLARAHRLAELEGSPKVTIERPSEFFAKAEAEYPNAPVWAGELYLEFHRATYTSQAQMKQGNRRCEHLLREAELWSATAAVRSGFAYPHDALDRCWKTVLTNQFHDILPGTSIAWVHRQARQEHAEVAAELEEVIDAAQRALAGSGGESLVFNAAPHSRNDVAPGSADAAVAPDGVVVATAVNGGWVLDNGLVRVTIDARGLVTSVVDVETGRDAIAPGTAANVPQIHPDLPNEWDAWDLDTFYRNTRIDVTAVDNLALTRDADRSSTVEVSRTFGESSIVQRLSLTAGRRAVDVETEIDWRETEKILKVAFPFDVRADFSSAETQFGYINRPTHSNTTWDAAKFEICAHRYLHLGEPGWGVAVVNDSTYGHDVTRDVREDGGTTTTVRLSLLRAPRFPDPEADHGTHRFGYSIVPGAEIIDAVREGYRRNLPERVRTGSGPVAPLAQVDNERVIVETVKLADDRCGDVIVRIYEAAGGRTTVSLTPGFAFTAVAEVDLLERPLGDTIAGRDGTVHLDFRPFQIRTIRFTDPSSAR